MNKSNLRVLTPKDHHKQEVNELQRLLACYQIASFDDKKVIWAVLNKYVKHISI